jgi:hypothetical protein
MLHLPKIFTAVVGRPAPSARRYTRQAPDDTRAERPTTHAPSAGRDTRRAPDDTRAGMFAFDLAMLQGKAPGRRPMLVIVGDAGLVLGAWIGRDLR